MERLTVSTRSRTQFIDITGEARRHVRKSGVSEGLLFIYVPHTTAAVTINENADPDVMADMAHALEKIVPWSDKAYLHGEGNSAAHVKSSMLGCSATVIISGGDIVLGSWQGVYFAEFDGPRNRTVFFKIVAG